MIQIYLFRGVTKMVLVLPGAGNFSTDKDFLSVQTFALRRNHPRPDNFKGASMSLQPYQQRVAEEMNDLNAKIERLKEFVDSPIFDTLDAIDQGLLIAQCDAMGAYSTILGMRVLKFQ